MTSRRLRALVPAAALFVSACSGDGSPERNALRDAVMNPSTTTTVETVEAPDNPALKGLGGLIATTDRAGLQLIDPTSGAIEAEFFGEGFVTQPTWSRDGSRLVAMAYDAATVGRLLLVDPVSGTSREAPASRPYFFFSWSPDGSMIAALGPGSPNPDRPPLTTLDILDHEGRLVSTGRLEGGSLYLAWEPDGHSLLVHLDDSLLLLDDPTDLTATAELATPGVAFQAPAWVRGTRSALIVADRPGDGELIRIDVESGEQVDLGPAGTFTLMAVAPDGRTAAVAHAPAEATSAAIGLEGDRPGGSAVAGIGPEAPSRVSALVELVDLQSGERTPISDVAALWIEWNPPGDALILLHIDLNWSVWADGTLRTLARSRPSDIFFNQYVVYSGQYVETPRLWSPNGSAVTYSGQTEDGNRFFVLPVDGDDEPTAIDLGQGHVAFWSPS